MNKQLLLGCLAALAASTSAQADALPFFSSQFDATVVAVTNDGLPGYDNQSGALGATVSLSANSIGATDVSTAGAIIDTGLMTTSADVSAGAVGNAVASAHFMGSFVNGSAVNLRLDFSSNNASSGTGAAATTLFVSLTSNGLTLFSGYVPGAWTYAYAPAVGSTSLLDLTLTSDVSAAFPTGGAGNASSFGLVTITGSVPEASTWLLFALGLGAVGGLRLRTQCANATRA